MSTEAKSQGFRQRVLSLCKKSQLATTVGRTVGFLSVSLKKFTSSFP